MKSRGIFHIIYLIFLGSFLLTSSFEILNAQDTKKNRIRIKADYIKVMGGEIYLNIKTTSRIDKENIEVPNLDLAVYNELDDEEILLGNTKTDLKGEAKFVIDNLNTVKPDSTYTYNLAVSFVGNDYFKRASRSISFKNAAIKAELVRKDSINYIKATLSDINADSL